MNYIAKNPDIRVAQLLQERYAPMGADGVIILTMKKGVIVGGVSYGETKRLCSQYGIVLDRFVNQGGKVWF